MEKLLSEKIKHIKFGFGLIAGVEGDVGEEKIIVEFDELAEKKKFEYPDAFEYFVKFEKTSLQENAIKQLQDKKIRIIKEKRREDWNSINSMKFIKRKNRN